MIRLILFKMEKSYIISKFEGHEFHTWQVKVQLILIEKDLWEIVNGTNKKPQDVDEALKWTTKDRKAIEVIGLGLSDAYLHHIDLTKTSNQIWESLNSLFGSHTSSDKMGMKQKLFGLKMNEGDSIAQHITTFYSLLNQLAGIKCTVDDDVKAILLNIMLSSFHNIVFTLNKLNPSPSLENVISYLIDE